MLFSSNPVIVVGKEKAKLQDEFHVSSEDGLPIRGIVYSSNPYVRIPKPQFDGTEVTIRFEVRGQNYSEGDHLQGYFTIVCNGGEYRLPFDVKFSRERLLCSTGEITSLEDFAELAKGHWIEAMQLFYSDTFAGFMCKRDIQEQLLYTGYRRAVPSSLNLEEFLVSAGLKQPISFSVNEQEKNFYRVTENRKETLLVSKSTWGYVEIDIECDSDFVTVEKERITSDYFLGSTMLLSYYIHKNRMHAGKNYARITFSCKGIVREFQIMATFDREGATHEWSARQQKHEMVLLTKTYEEYRFRRMTTGEWCERTVAIVDDMLRRDSDNQWYRLIKAHCYIVNKQRQEALWIIQDLKRDIADKSSVAWAYLLYLCTLIEQEESYVNRLTKEIEGIFRQHPEDPRMFWFLSFLREEYLNNSARKLRAMEQWIEAGNPSPFLYIEVYGLYLQDPYLFHEFKDMSVRILYWAAKKNALTRDLAVQICHVLEKTNQFSEKIWFIVQKAYKLYENREFLSCVVSYLLRNQLYEERFLSWYHNGIERELRLNGLYEAYMMTLPDTSTDKLPQMLVLYFRYSCNLPYQKKALLYANVILNRKSMPQLYQQYLRAMELFAIEQMKLNRMNDNLAIVYQNVLEMGIVDEDMAKAVSGMVFMRKVVCVYPEITRILVYQEQYEMPIVVPVVNKVAYVPIVSKHFQVFMETRWGTLITDRNKYQLQRVMFTNAYMDKLKNLSPLSLPFILSDFDDRTSAADLVLDDINKIDAFIHSPLVSKAYVRQKYPLFVSFLRDHCREEILEKHFAEEVDYTAMSRDSLTYIMTLFLSQEHFKEAFDMMEDYYALDVDGRLLLQMCDEFIIDTGFERNDLMLGICGYLAEQNLATPATIAYLANNTVGPTAWMIQLWKMAKEQDLRVDDLEENILFQALYAESHLQEAVPIFASYMLRGRDKMLIEAYVTYWSHEYMLDHQHVPEELFTYLAYFFDREDAMKESCNLAYMKFLSTVKLLSDREFEILDELLRQYVLRNMYFGFYKNLDQRLIVKYHLYDKCFIEYRGEPGDHIKIVYQYNDKEMVEEDMTEIYEGIFVKQFVIFFGETISYALFSERGNDVPVLTDKLVVSTLMQEGKQDRYDLINRMQNELLYNERQELSRDLKLYQGLDQVTNALFTTI